MRITLNNIFFSINQWEVSHTKKKNEEKNTTEKQKKNRSAFPNELKLNLRIKSLTKEMANSCVCKTFKHIGSWTIIYKDWFIYSIYFISIYLPTFLFYIHIIFIYLLYICFILILLYTYFIFVFTYFWIYLFFIFIHLYLFEKSITKLLNQYLWNVCLIIPLNNGTSHRIIIGLAYKKNLIIQKNPMADDYVEFLL